jgi:hypothetical protein
MLEFAQLKYPEVQLREIVACPGVFLRMLRLLKTINEKVNLEMGK